MENKQNIYKPSALGIRFEQIARDYPDSTIKDVWNQVITFTQLHSAASELAGKLKAYLGVDKRHVCIESQKLPENLVVVAACWMLNWSYTFFDKQQPKERINHIITSSSSSLIAITENKSPNPFFSRLEMTDTSLLRYSFYFSDKIIYPYHDKTSYIMFTSGSTGVPKGVPILDYQVVNLTDWLIHEFNIKNSDVLTGLNPWYFDNSVFDIHMSLLSGANLLICDTDDSSKGLAWIEALAQKKPTVWFSVPSLLVLVQSLGSFKENRMKSLRLIIFGGEAYPKNLLNELIVDQGTRTEYVSVYGPTESTCICSTTKVTQKELESGEQYISLGNFPNFFSLSLHNTYLLSSGELAGELMLGGVNVASSYAQVDNNVGKFLNFPDANGDWHNYYLTGDLVYFSQALRSYCFLGRKDNQIKRLGIRIELEEIESRLEKASGTIVIADYDSGRTLDLCILFLKSESVNEDFMEKICKDFLPPYMLPRRVIGANELPLNPNGKKDRRAAKQKVKFSIGNSIE